MILTIYKYNFVFFFAFFFVCYIHVNEQNKRADGNVIGDEFEKHVKGEKIDF